LPNLASLKLDSPNLAFLNIELSEHASLKLARDPALPVITIAQYSNEL
jgi:hypothetical protein